MRSNSTTIKFVLDDIYADSFGTFLSGYTPIKDKEGHIVAMLGADVKVDKVIARQNFIGNTIYYIMAIAILIAGFILSLVVHSDRNKYFY